MSTTARDTDADWKRVADTDPYWGVLSHEEYRQASIDDEKLSKFMKSGADYVANLYGLVRKHLLPQFSPSRVLDVGCGVGRLLLPFAKNAQQAVGVDVAPAMLDRCRKHADDAGITNIELIPGDDSLSLVNGQFDLVNTYIVLQHVTPIRGYRLLEAMVERLKKGGVASLQCTYAKSSKYLTNEQARCLYYRRDGDTIQGLVQSSWTPPVGTISMFDYDLNEVMARLTAVSGHPIITLPTQDDNHLGLHLIFVKAK